VATIYIDLSRITTGRRPLFAIGADTLRATDGKGDTQPERNPQNLGTGVIRSKKTPLGAVK
jgi:hypothetical protein